MKYIITILIALFLSLSSAYAQITFSVFPKNNIWNTPIDNAPIDKNSGLYIQTVGASVSLHPDFGSGLWNNAPIGIPYAIVDNSVVKQSVTFEYSDESDSAPYPIPNNPPIEGGDSSNGDRHILIINKDEQILYELYSAYQNNDGSWRAGSGAIFDLSSNKLRPDGWTSADAAGLPIFPGLVRYDEAQSGEINHAIRLTVPKTRKAYIWPARHYASSLTDEKYPPMGQRFRLKKEYDISKFSTICQTILKAIKKYGLILADNGSAWFISGAPDEGWDDEALGELKQIKGSELEAIDESSLQIEPNSAEAKQETDVRGIEKIADCELRDGELIISIDKPGALAIETFDLLGDKIKLFQINANIAGEYRIKFDELNSLNLIRVSFGNFTKIFKISE